MPDSVLVQFVQQINGDLIPPLQILLFIPGGPVSGLLISNRRFMEELEESLTAVMRDPEDGHESRDFFLSEAHLWQEGDTPALPDILCLENAYLPASKTVIGLLRVDLNAIQAWTFHAALRE